MILVDTCVWIDHFRSTEPTLARLLEDGAVLAHPWVTGELALGNLNRRDEIIQLMGDLPQATVATDAEVLHLIRTEGLSSCGIGYVDAQLAAATRLTPDGSLWTQDKRLSEVAKRLRLAAPLSPPA